MSRVAGAACLCPVCLHEKGCSISDLLRCPSLFDDKRRGRGHPKASSGRAGGKRADGRGPYALTSGASDERQASRSRSGRMLGVSEGGVGDVAAIAIAQKPGEDAENPRSRFVIDVTTMHDRAQRDAAPDRLAATAAAGHGAAASNAYGHSGQHSDQGGSSFRFAAPCTSSRLSCVLLKRARRADMLWARNQHILRALVH
eukprot:6191615-Pleurochrysis_carterae.AAC.2